MSFVPRFPCLRNGTLRMTLRVTLIDTPSNVVGSKVVLSYGCRPMSSRVGNAIPVSKWGMVENIWLAVGIASLYISAQSFFLLPVHSLPF